MAGRTERERMLRGELYHAFTPDLVAARARCKWACKRFNDSGEVSRRRQIELWREIIQDPTPLPQPATDPAADEALFENEPWIEAPIRMDYGFNVKVGAGAFINFNCVILDTCLVTIGARTLLGPNVNIYSGTHPLDPALRNGTKGPELGKEVHIGEDCWIGGNVDILPGVRIGRGATIGAGSVVNKDVPAFHVAAGNPARIIRRIETSMATTDSLGRDAQT
ncbi:acetyltransferase [Paracoccidioides lutzii Pb01]|uniref:Acetyltransferase n=1 Tax=Paracoccidioides lutzii (strain ATCC MYA-826 / Pb01) TaxID=502779 RepID=C1H9T1_PARBA|nr:acetyltransferase [Paracoccidioides lutzii Pb01]EEH37104.1 acetyltransferase [Paracoccidioides lutzii Pb01]